LWPPEFVIVAIDDPVRMVSRCGKAGHACHPLGLGVIISLLIDDFCDPKFAKFLQDVSGSIDRKVVGDDEVIDSTGEVVLDVLPDQVFCVANEQGHYDLHPRDILVANSRDILDLASG
jgi:hypothetical protein